MVHSIEIASRIDDSRGEVRKKSLHTSGFTKISNVQVVDSYLIDKSLRKKELEEIARSLTNPVVSSFTVDQPFPVQKFSWVIHIAFLPGVTDNVGNTVREMIQDELKISFDTSSGVYYSQLFYITGSLTPIQTKQIADSWHNPLIQRASVKSYPAWIKEQGRKPVVPRVRLDSHPKVYVVDLDVSDEELVAIGKKGIANRDGTRRGPLALDLVCMKTIREHFRNLGRNPTDVELESIAQTWSEHCKHTIFADPIDDIKDGLYKTYIKASTNAIRKKKGKKDFCVSVFTDNSGAIAFDDDYLITDKVETHNSPSALDPFGGSITGIVGVNRDAIGFGLGAKPIINRYGFCFADPGDSIPLYKGPNHTQKMLSPRRIMDGVVDGVNAGGNCSGIPTPAGFLYFDRRYKGKPLVFVGTVGLIPRKSHGRKTYVKKANPGDYIVMVGGRVGLDGIHGATFSSEAMDIGSPATAVQIGDPITQKKLSDAIVKEARDLGLYTSITDNGAGGLSCSVAEMAKESGGCRVVLDDVPLKYPGLAPWQTWISESQERMTLAVGKNKWKQFADLMKKRGVEATVIGEFTDSGKCVVQYHGKTVMDVDMDFLHDGLPPRPMKTTDVSPNHEEPVFPQPKNLTKKLDDMLSRLNIASFEFISMQYDHEVQGGSVLKPLQGRGRVNADATVTRPVLSSEKGVVLSQGLYPRYSDIDTYHMAAASIDTAIRNAVAAGADIDYLALLDNFCWCSGNEPERLGQLKRTAQACYDYTVVFETPFISGKDSMFNDFKGYDEKGNPVKISVPPTLLISSIGVVQDVTKSISIDLKFPGDLIYILGETFDELGASEYFAMMGEKNGKTWIGNTVPKVDAKKNRVLYKAVYRCAQKSLVASAISIGTGGLGVALAKIAIAGMLGIDISLKNLPGNMSRDDYALFSESQGRIIVSVNPKNAKKFEQLMSGNACTMIGKVTSDGMIRVKGLDGETIVETDTEKLLEAYKKRFRGY